MSCAPLEITVGGVVMSTSDFENAKELIAIGGDTGDPTLDADDESIANGNNTAGRKGIQFPPSKQTAPPSEIPFESKETRQGTPPGGNGVPVSCTLWIGDYDYQLSPNFKVRDFSVNAVFKNQIITIGSLTASDRVCNLQSLAVNIAEPIRAKFGPFVINSGIRNSNTALSGTSQHVLGQAMDIQFTGWSYSRYWQNALWIRDNIKYDQFIFEHSPKGTAWYHLSFNPAGNRPPSNPKKVMTMYRNYYDSGLKRYYG